MKSIMRLAVGAFCLGLASPAWAEVADKEPTLGYLAAWALGINVVAALLALLRTKLGLIVLPISALFAYAGHLELTDPYVGPDILRELGQGYVIASYLIYALALIGPILIVVLTAKLKRPRH